MLDPSLKFRTLINPMKQKPKNRQGSQETAGLWFGPFPCNGSLGMGKSASLRPPMPLVAVQRWWVAIASRYHRYDRCPNVAFEGPYPFPDTAGKSETPFDL